MTPYQKLFVPDGTFPTSILCRMTTTLFTNQPCVSGAPMHKIRSNKCLVGCAWWHCHQAQMLAECIQLISRTPEKKAKSRVSLRGLGFVLDDTVIKHKQEQSWDADVSAWGLFTNSWLLFASNPSSSGDKPQSLWVSHPCYVPVRAVFSSLKYESIIVQVH